MNEGLLWFDANPKRPAQEKLAAAAARFAERFRRAANCCHVHPSQQFADPKIHVVGDANVLPNHLWVGRDETLAPLRRPRSVPAARPPAPIPLRPVPATRSTASARPNRRPAKGAAEVPSPARPARPSGKPSPAEPARRLEKAGLRPAAAKSGRTVAKPAPAVADRRPASKAKPEKAVLKRATAEEAPVKQPVKKAVSKQAVAKQAVAKKAAPKKAAPKKAAPKKPAKAGARTTPPTNDRKQAVTPRRSPARGRARPATGPARRPGKTLRRPA